MLIDHAWQMPVKGGSLMAYVAWKIIKGHGPYAYLRQSVWRDGQSKTVHLGYLGLWAGASGAPADGSDAIVPGSVVIAPDGQEVRVPEFSPSLLRRLGASPVEPADGLGTSPPDPAAADPGASVSPLETPDPEAGLGTSPPESAGGLGTSSPGSSEGGLGTSPPEPAGGLGTSSPGSSEGGLGTSPTEPAGGLGTSSPGSSEGGLGTSPTEPAGGLGTSPAGSSEGGLGTSPTEPAGGLGTSPPVPVASAPTPARPLRLPDGSWGVLSTEPLAVGGQVRVTTSGGQSWTATVTEVLETTERGVTARTSGRPPRGA